MGIGGVIGGELLVESYWWRVIGGELLVGRCPSTTYQPVQILKGRDTGTYLETSSALVVFLPRYVPGAPMNSIK